jgi:hypothetical protein
MVKGICPVLDTVINYDLLDWNRTFILKTFGV